MPRIDSSAGSIPVSGSSTSIGKSVATVQLGESKLSEVAQRLGVDPHSLHNANPQVADANKLKVGQELNLPDFQPAQNLKQNDADSSLQSQSSQSGLPRAPLGDSLAKNAMQARLSASDLAQVPGGAQQINPEQLKPAEKLHTYDVAFKEDKWSKADTSPEAFKYAGASKGFQKADDLAQVAGGAGRVDLQRMKEYGKIGSTGHLKEASKLIDANKAIKLDKSTDAEKASVKADQAAKVFEITQDVTVNKAKTADKAFTQMDGYIRQ
jgi:hypothetical protein